jgi:hypothetical protein
MASADCAHPVEICVELDLAIDALETSTTWRSEAFEDTPVLLRNALPSETCAMFHLPIADVAVDGLGALWHDTRTYNAAQLPCGHVFNACALAVHFATNDMRCPVCRRGPEQRAQISSMAPAMQPALLRAKNDMHARADDDVSVDLNVDALARDFVFEVSPDTFFQTLAV